MSNNAARPILDLYEAQAAGRFGDEVRHLFTDDVIIVTHPNRVAPAGGVADLNDMLLATARGAALLSEQHYDVRAIDVVGEVVICRSTWTGRVRADAGPFRAGEVLRAEVAQFVTVKAGRIARIETFDCYDAA